MLIFGLDIGTTSIGSVALRMDDRTEDGDIAHMGVRIFPEARDPDGAPLNQTRRQKRLVRRQLRRRRQRRRALNELLAGHGLLPPFAADRHSGWAAAMGADPWALRARAISEALTPYELGRALYHLARQRHFRGRDLEPEDAAEETAEEKQAENQRAHDRAALKASGLTLGAYLATIAVPAERRRHHHFARTDVKAEFDRIVEVQQPFHPILADAGFAAALEEAIFAQRPVFWRRATLGRCRFVPGADLAASASWLAQERRLLEKVNNLRIGEGNGRPLDTEERAAILALLRRQDSATWGKIRTTLKPYWRAHGLPESPAFNLERSGELERGGEKGLTGNRLENRLAEIFGARWEDRVFADRMRREVHARLYAADYGVVGQRIVIRREAERQAARLAARAALQADFGLTEPQADALAGLSFAPGWDPFSTAALEIFLPRLQEGVPFGTLLAAPEEEPWRAAMFPGRDQPTGAFVNRLPSPTRKYPEEMARMRDIRNPTVVRVQNEVRKVVNNLIDTYGKPDLIRVEVTRAVGRSKREREEEQSRNRNREKERKHAAAKLMAHGIAEPSRADIEKWLLWKECGEYCPYTNRPISFAALFGTGEFQVEHIWPRSISFDDSFANKTLCHVSFNALKSNRTPFEAFAGREGEWQDALARVGRFNGPPGRVAAKRKRFAAETLPEGFAARQLNDTGYAARQAVGFLKSLWPDEGPAAPVRVQVVTGRVTQHLRRLWGLNHLLADDGEKSRADHRHHAVDALVVALAHGGYTQKLSRWFATRDAPARLDPPPLDPPIADLRAKAAAAVAGITVSHRVRRKVSGPLHADTVYGDGGPADGTGKIAYRWFTTRKAVESLSPARLKDDETFADAHIRDIVRQWVADHGGDPKKAFAAGYPTVSPGGPPIRKVRIRVKQQLSLMAKVGTGHADFDKNHHVAIYRTAAGKVEAEIVSLFEAATRLRRGEPVVRRQRDGAAFLFSLGAGDMVRIPAGDRAGLWVVNGINANSQVVIHRAEDATGKSEYSPRAASIVKMNARKVAVDPIGRICPAAD